MALNSNKPPMRPVRKPAPSKRPVGKPEEKAGFFKQISQGLDDASRDHGIEKKPGIIEKINSEMHKEPEEPDLIQRLRDERESEKNLKKGRNYPRHTSISANKQSKSSSGGQKIVIMTEEEAIIREYENLLRDDLYDLEMILEAETAMAEEDSNEPTGKEYKSGADDTCPAGHQWVYMFLVNAKLPTSKIIKWWTKKPYAHSALSFDKSLTNMCSFSNGDGHNGFVRENLRSTYKPDASFSLYKIAVPNEAVIVMKDAIKNIEQCRDGEYKYSMKGLAGFVFRRHASLFNTDKHKMFCSQFCARMFASAGLKIFGDRPDYTIHPYDFAKNKNFKFCYKGLVKNYDPSRVR